MSLDICKTAGLPDALLSLIEDYYGLPDGWFLSHRLSSMSGGGREFGFFTIYSTMSKVIEEWEEEDASNIYLWSVVNGKTTRFLIPIPVENCYVPRLVAWYFDQTIFLEDLKQNNYLQVYPILKVEYEKRNVVEADCFIGPFLLDPQTCYFNSLFGPMEWTWFA
jgi:hypothetical protein